MTPKSLAEENRRRGRLLADLFTDQGMTLLCGIGIAQVLSKALIDVRWDKNLAKPANIISLLKAAALAIEKQEATKARTN